MKSELIVELVHGRFAARIVEYSNPIKIIPLTSISQVGEGAAFELPEREPDVEPCNACYACDMNKPWACEDNV